MKVLALSIISLALSCSVETVNLTNEDQKPKEELEELVSEELGGEEETSVGGDFELPGEAGGQTKIKQRNRVVNKFEIESLNHTKFVSPNYCLGQRISDCWIKSGHLTEYADGRFKLVIEWEDTYDSKPYTVVAEDVEHGQAVLVSELARIEADDSFEDKYIWVVVDLEEYTLTVVYDWDKDGPQEVGDDNLNILEFLDVEL